MKIIISPAKKMDVNTDLFECSSLPAFLSEAGLLAHWVKTLSYPEAKKLWVCNDGIAELNYTRFREMDLKHDLTPALLSYEGIQYQYMAPQVFSEKEWDYVQEHLRILSGFYGVLKPLDGVKPYRLEMQAKTDKSMPPLAVLPAATAETDPAASPAAASETHPAASPAAAISLPVEKPVSLYAFWGKKLYQAVRDESRTILNLASKEYSKAVEPWLLPEDHFITCTFGEWQKDTKAGTGKIIQKGTQAKMARGEMVRFMAEHSIENVEDIQKFDRLGYQFHPEFSNETTYTFIKKS